MRLIVLWLLQDLRLLMMLLTFVIDGKKRRVLSSDKQTESFLNNLCFYDQFSQNYDTCSKTITW